VTWRAAGRSGGIFRGSFRPRYEGGVCGSGGDPMWIVVRRNRFSCRDSSPPDVSVHHPSSRVTSKGLPFSRHAPQVRSGNHTGRFQTSGGLPYGVGAAHCMGHWGGSGAGRVFGGVSRRFLAPGNLRRREAERGRMWRICGEEPWVVLGFVAILPRVFRLPLLSSSHMGAGWVCGRL